MALDKLGSGSKKVYPRVVPKVSSQVRPQKIKPSTKGFTR
jgi:hypothetical protein